MEFIARGTQIEVTLEAGALAISIVYLSFHGTGAVDSLIIFNSIKLVYVLLEILAVTIYPYPTNTWRDSTVLRIPLKDIQKIFRNFLPDLLVLSNNFFQYFFIIFVILYNSLRRVN